MIFFDTETTGLLMPDASDIALQPHIIEFAAIKSDENLEEVSRIEFFVKPPISIPAEVTKITGLTDEHVKDAEPLISRMVEIQEFFLGEKILVAHNVSYDVGVLHYELNRLGLQNKFPWPMRHICTVENTMQIKGHRLNLSALHEHLFGEKFKSAHRAMVDVEALLRCFRRLVDDGEIVL